MTVFHVVLVKVIYLSVLGIVSHLIVGFLKFKTLHPVSNVASVSGQQA